MRETRYEIVKKISESSNQALNLEDLLGILENVIVVDKNIDHNTSFNSFSSNVMYVNEEWIAHNPLGEKADDKPVLDELDSYKKRINKSSDQYKLNNKYEELNDMYDKLDQFSSMITHLKPTSLTKRMNNADLVIIPPEYVEKIRSEIPKAQIAVLADKPISIFNYPNITYEILTLGPEPTARIDSKTIKLLFNTEKRDSNIFSFDFDEFYTSIDDTFLADIAEKKSKPGINRTTFIEHHPERKFKSTRGYPKFKESETKTAFRNFYGMGKRYIYTERFQRGNSDEFIEWRRKKVIKFCEQLWTQPLTSINQANDRLLLYDELINNPDYRKKLLSIATGIESLVTSYFHLSGMANHISSNILRSKFGARIHKESFYDDFTYIAKLFTLDLELIRTNLAELDSNSNEMRVILEPLKSILSKENLGNLHKTYSFLKRIIDAKPEDFHGLEDIFKNQLQKQKAHKIPELEDYDPNNDPYFWYAYLKREKGVIRSMQGCKSPTLKALLNKFHFQNPVTCSEVAINFLNTASIKLEVYVVKANYMAKHNWSKPEILPGNLGVIDIKKGYYPLTRLQHTNEYIANDTYLDSNDRIEIIDGPNITGKTIDVKKSLFIAACALTGSYVPADQSTRISFFDRIRYRIKDTGMMNTSAFVQELATTMEEIKAIGSSIFAAYDEAYSSTNDVEGEAFLYATIRRFSEESLVRAVFTSHFPSLQNILEDHAVKGVKFSHFEFKKKEGKLLFPHIKKRMPNKIGDYAIDIAEQEGVSPYIINFARNYKND